MVAQMLASQFNRDVDLIDLQQASTVFQAQIVHTGKILYCKNEEHKARYELKTLKMYTKLKEDRSSILTDVGKRGAIYEE